MAACIELNGVPDETRPLGTCERDLFGKGSLHTTKWCMGKNLPADAGDTGDGVQSPGQEDPLEEEMATHSSILAWEIPWTQEPGRLQSGSYKESNMTEQLSTQIRLGFAQIYGTCLV